MSSHTSSPLDAMPVPPEQSPSSSPFPEAPKPSFFSNLALFFLEVIKIVIIAAVTIVLVRYFLFKPFYVKGQSMFPTYKENEYLIVDRISPRFHEYERGEVIVFRAPVGDQKDFYLKRIIGLPGEQVKIYDHKVVICNDDHPECVLVQEGYLQEDTGGSINITLREDEYFVMGDNRGQSYDSRQFGPIHRGTILGRTVFRGWPVSRMMTIQKPEYNF